jgi:tetratricopeptide (TPR) repeat protein
VSNAVKFYQESLRIIPNYISSLNNLGMIYYSFYNQPQNAIPYLKKAISLDTNYVEAYFNLATCEAKSGQKETAEIHYLKTIEIDPDFINTYNALSSMYAEDKEYEKILELNRSGIEKGILSDMLHINMGNVYFIMGDTINGITCLAKGVEANPKNRQLGTFLANYYRSKGDLNKFNYYFELVAKSTD